MRTYVHNFDTKLTMAIQHWRGLEGLMTVFTTLGHPVVVLGICTIIVVAGIVKENQRLVYAGLTAVVTLGAGSLLKLVLRRDRPITEYVNNMMFTSFSFPSGHTVGATVIYGLLAYLAWHFFPQPWSSIIAGLFIVLLLAVGVSRVYLGAHFPSDVVAGLLLGCVGLAVIIFIIKPSL